VLPLTPVTNDAVAVPVLVKESIPIRDKNFVGSVIVTLTRMARTPAADTVNLS